MSSCERLIFFQNESLLFLKANSSQLQMGLDIYENTGTCLHKWVWRSSVLKQTCAKTQDDVRAEPACHLPL